MHLLRVLIVAFLLGGCASNFTSFRENEGSTLSELHAEIEGLRHTLHGTEVEVKLLEERLERSEESTAAIASDETRELKKRVAALEKTIHRIHSDLQTLTTHVHQTTSSLSTQQEQISTIDHKLDEIAKLRSTLAKLSQTSHQAESLSIYRVKPGDSLEKIARQYRVSVEALKRENKLSSDKIVVDQELTIPHL